MKNVKIISGILLLVISIGLISMFKIDSAEAIVWDKKAIDCTWHFGTQCTGQGNGCDAVPCEQYKNPNPSIEFAP